MGVLTILPPTVLQSLTPSTRSTDGNDEGWWNLFTGGSSDADILDGLTNGLIYVSTSIGASFNMVMLLKWDTTTPVFSLDGGPLKNFAELPNGFLINGTISLGVEHRGPSSGPFLARFRDEEINQAADVSGLFNDLFTPGLAIAQAGDPTVFIDASEFVAATFRIEMNGPKPTGLALVEFVPGGGPFTLTGLYTEFSQTWEIFLPEGEPARPGDQLHIISPEDSDNDLTNVDKVSFTIPSVDEDGNDITRKLTINKNGTFTIKDIDEDGVETELLINEDSPYVFEWDDEIIKIIIPTGFGDYEGPVETTPAVNPPRPFPPSEFSGEVTIGTFEIEFADTSGIYNITPNKTNDTLYDREGDTIDVAIPKPFIRTGFISG